MSSVPTITIDDMRQLEGDDATSIVFTVTRSGKSNQASTVDYATAGSSATAGDDYESAVGTLVFAPGEKTKTIGVTVLGDLNSEPDEEFFVNLFNPVGATIGDNQGQGTIEDDDSVAMHGTIYVYSLTYDTRQRGPHTEIQFTIDVRIDDHDGDRENDVRAVGVSIVLSIYDTAVTELNGDSNIRNFVGTLDEGIGTTYWYKLPGPGDYHVEVHDLALSGYLWDHQLESGFDDGDEDGRPEILLSVR